MVNENIKNVKGQIEDSVKRVQDAIFMILDNMIKRTTSGTVEWHLLEQNTKLVEQVKLLFRETDETFFLSQSYYCEWNSGVWLALNIMDGNDRKVDYLISVPDQKFIIRCSEFFKEKGTFVKKQDPVAQQRFAEMVDWLLLEIQQQFLNKSLYVIEQAAP